MVTLPPAGSVSGAGAGTSEDGGCRKERELHPAPSTSDGKDTVADRGSIQVPVLGTTDAQMLHGDPRSVTRRQSWKFLLQLGQLQR